LDQRNNSLGTHTSPACSSQSSPKMNRPESSFARLWRCAGFSVEFAFLLVCSSLVGFPLSELSSQGKNSGLVNLVVGSTAHAAEQTSPKVVVRQARPVSPSAISIAIDTSRQSPSAGQGLGVTAQIENSSSDPVCINERSTVLALPPEITIPGQESSMSWFGTFPTEDHNKNDLFFTICIKPGDVYKVLWVLSQKSTSEDHGKSADQSRSDQGRLAEAVAVVKEAWTSLFSLVKVAWTFLCYSPGDF